MDSSLCTPHLPLSHVLQYGHVVRGSYMVGVHLSFQTCVLVPPWPVMTAASIVHHIAESLVSSQLRCTVDSVLSPNALQLCQERGSSSLLGRGSLCCDSSSVRPKLSLDPRSHPFCSQCPRHSLRGAPAGVSIRLSAFWSNELLSTGICFLFTSSI